MTVRILHLHSTFSLGGKEARAVRLMNAWGDAARHVVVSAMPDEVGAAGAIAPGIAWSIDPAAPPLAGKPSFGRYRALVRYQRGFDLVLSYNWGAMDGVMANRLLGGPPLIHHEDGFNADEATGTRWDRDLFRRIALGRARALVVPSRRLETLAARKWIAPARLHRIANGIPVAGYAGPPADDADALLALPDRPGAPVIGTLAGLRTVKNLPRLVRAVAASGTGVTLAIVGEGPERAAIAAEAARTGVAVAMPGFRSHPARFIGRFDLFALSSDSEQAPIGVIEAMAAGLAVVAPRVGDVAAMVSAENRVFIVPPGDEAALAAAITRLVADPDLRRRVGAANRLAARERFDEAAMIAAYRALYAGAIGRPGALG